MPADRRLGRSGHERHFAGTCHARSGHIVHHGFVGNEEGILRIGAGIGEFDRLSGFGPDGVQPGADILRAIEIISVLLAIDQSSSGWSGIFCPEIENHALSAVTVYFHEIPRTVYSEERVFVRIITERTAARRRVGQ